jgi:predicted dehydrogenase
MTTALRGAIIGFGAVAEHAHLPAWRASKDMRIVAVAEPDADRRARAEALVPGVVVHGDAAHLLRESSLDFVDVATPPSLHAPSIIAAAAAGVHVLCEKPLTSSLEEYVRVRDAVVQAGVTLFTVHNWKFSDPFRRVQALLAEGAIGPLTSIEFETVRDGCAGGSADDWRTRHALAGGGILVDHGWHAFYLMLALARERPLTIRTVLARRRYVAADVEDTAECTIQFPSLVGRLRLTWAGNERRTQWRLCGRDGRIEVTDDVVMVDRGGTRDSFVCSGSLSASSYHPEWFAPIIEAFRREITDGTARGENLAEAELCTLLLSRAYASHADAARAQTIPTAIGSGERSVCAS